MRDWIYIDPGLRTLSYLYRIDNPTNSEIWFSEDGTNVLLGTYTYQHDLTTAVVLETHIGGTDNVTLGTTQPVIFSHTNGFTTQSQTYQELLTTPAETADLDQETGAFAPSTGVDARAYIDDDRTHAGSSFLLTTAVRYFFPSGEYQGDTAGTHEFSSSVAVSDSLTSDYDTNSSVDIFVNGTDVSGSFLFGLFGTTDIDHTYGTTPGSQGPTTVNYTSDNYTLGPVYLELSHFKNNACQNNLNILSELTSVPSGETLTTNLFTESNMSSFAVRFRPRAALSKTDTLRFATVEYFDAGVPKIDYFVIPDSFTATKATATYPSVPTTDAADPAPFWVTKSYSGSTPGTSFTLNGGLLPDPAFNVSSGGDLIAFPGFDDNLSIYSGAVTLTKDINGVQTSVKAKGLGLVPDRILAVCDLP